MNEERDATEDMQQGIQRSVEATLEALRTTQQEAEAGVLKSIEATATAATREAEAEVHRSVNATLTARSDQPQPKRSSSDRKT